MMTGLSRSFGSPRLAISAVLPHLRPVTSPKAQFPRFQHTSPKPSAVLEAGTSIQRSLRRMGELSTRVAAENRKTVKAEIIAEYPDLRAILEQVYNPNFRAHISFKTLNTIDQSMENLSEPPYPDITSLEELFDVLSQRKVSGNMARWQVYSTLQWNWVHNGPLWETFGRLLDRNLVAGFGAKTLLSVPWGDGGSASVQTVSTTSGSSSTAPLTASPKVAPSVDPSPTITSSPSSGPLSLSAFADSSSSTSSSSHSIPQIPLSATNSSTSSLSATSSASSSTSSGSFSTRPRPPITPGLEKFEVALGKTLEDPSSIFNGKTKPTDRWFASRKLDGVRVLTLIDFKIPSPEVANGIIEVVDMAFVSRTGKPFTSLAKLEKQLLRIAGFPKLSEWLDRDSEIIRQEDDGIVKRLVLDGEVCVMRPHTPRASQPRDDGTNSLANSLWTSTENLIEDFPSTVAQVRTNATIPHPAYFIFDTLSWAELNARKAINTPGLGKVFSERVKEGEEIVGWLNGELKRLGVEEKSIKVLVQREVESVSQVEGMVARAAEEGWEGLILRADKPYKGTRSSDVRKFKKWQDAEYIVQSLETNTMRLFINGIPGEYNALARVWVEHKGHQVAIGSGFTAGERLRFAEDPGLIVGKQITVEYFSESKSQSRGEQVVSLRFPRVKQIWDGGGRDV